MYFDCRRMKITIEQRDNNWTEYLVTRPIRWKVAELISMLTLLNTPHRQEIVD